MRGAKESGIVNTIIVFVKIGILVFFSIVAFTAFQAGNFEPLLPDEMFSLAERAQGLKEWTLGFLEVVEDAGDAPRKKWSEPLREAIEDLAGLAAIETDIDDSAENENDLFALTEHARMAAMLLYTEQHPGTPQVEQVDETPPTTH